MRGLKVRTKIFLLFAGAALLTVVPALVLIGQAVQERVYERAMLELGNARDALREYWNAQDDALRESARRVARERRVPAMFEEGDTAQLRRVLAREVAEERVVLAADSTGRRLVGPVLDSATVHGGGGAVVVPEGVEAPLRVAVWPVFTDRPPPVATDSAPDSAAVAAAAPQAPDAVEGVEGDSVRVGLVGVGRRLDAEMLREMKNATGGDVALVAGDSVVATTLPDSLARVLNTLDLGAMLQRESIRRPEVDKLPYLFAVTLLPTRDRPTAVLLFRSVADELRIARGIQRSVIAIGVLALLVALVLALVVSRIVARPAQALAKAATDLARGNFNAPLPRTSGDEIGQLTHAFRDMRSAIAERETRLRSAQAELIHREKLAAMGRLVAQLSHEINNPIYNIQNCLEVLDRRGSRDDPNREFLELAREELSRMAVLTRQLLDQSRPVSDAARALDLNQMVQRVVTLARKDLEAHGIAIKLWMERQLPRVVAHPDAIQQVLANLVDNAMDAMPGGGRLTITTRSSSDLVEVVVEDTGAGIAEEDLPHIFEAFYTTKPGIRGIGLGLFVSEGIIRGHRGRLTVTSRLGEGSRFVVQLPRETLDESLAAPEAAPGQDAVAAREAESASAT